MAVRWGGGWLADGLLIRSCVDFHDNSNSSYYYITHINVSRHIVHFASLVALVVANRTSAAPLSSGAFLAIWMTFSLLFAIGGALWNALALIITAVLGGCVCH